VSSLARTSDRTVSMRELRVEKMAESEGFVGLASAGHFGLMAGSAHRLSPWPALEQRSEFLRAQKLTSKVCELASRNSLTPPIPGAKGGSASQRRLPGQSYTGAPCQLRPYCSLRLTPIRGTSADASPRPRSQRADGLRRGLAIR
jgi:hypothetical protein